jgi:hypothetical protein
MLMYVTSTFGSFALNRQVNLTYYSIVLSIQLHFEFKSMGYDFKFTCYIHQDIITDTFNSTIVLYIVFITKISRVYQNE